jgi:ParB family chromosome partitioning protein
MKTVPCFLCGGITDGDEIKFNQLHNLTDTHDCAALGKVEGCGFSQADAAAFRVQNDNATQLQEICKLMTKYGNLLCAVVCAGKVLSGARYVKACQLLRQPVNVFHIREELYGKAAAYLSADYGVYNYDKLARHTYVQGLAQMNRAAEKTEGKKQNKSALYTSLVLPYLAKNPTASVLDFGCGKGAYISAIRKNDAARRALGVEFYNHNNARIDAAKGNAQIDALARSLRQNGLFGVVVCDSVLNSVDSAVAEDAVLKCLNLFSKDKIFLSGRPLYEAVRRSNHKRRLDYSALVGNVNLFLDENNFTAAYRKGHWYYQHFHSEESLRAATERAGLRIAAWNWGCTSFQAVCEKARALTPDEARAAVDFEFTLPLPGGKRYEKNTEILRALSLLST